MTETDRHMMARALELAKEGASQVSPGPLVGCVIVSPGGEIAGEGFYIYEELNHAETLALALAGDKARGGTAYVSLEPHAHHGRTPPCTDALINAGIKRVVAPIEDPNPEVSGRGFHHLRAAGIETSTGLMAREAEKLNEKYLHFMRTGRPFVHVKLATSLDGKIATREGDSRWITGAAARARVHELRHEYDAILIGARTARADDPLLTDRSGKKRRKPLVRIVLDQSLSVSPESQLIRTADEAPVLIVAEESVSQIIVDSVSAPGVEIVQTGTDLTLILNELGERKIQSVLVEGGATVAGQFFDAGLVNKVSFFVAPKIIGGRDAPTAVAGRGAASLRCSFELHDKEIAQHGDDLEVTGYPVRADMRKLDNDASKPK